MPRWFKRFFTWPGEDIPSKYPMGDTGDQLAVMTLLTLDHLPQDFHGVEIRESARKYLVGMGSMIRCTGTVRRWVADVDMYEHTREVSKQFDSNILPLLVARGIPLEAKQQPGKDKL